MQQTLHSTTETTVSLPLYCMRPTMENQQLELEYNFAVGGLLLNLVNFDVQKEFQHNAIQVGLAPEQLGRKNDIQLQLCEQTYSIY